ncbi:MAG: M28 family peptidase [Acidobacteriota bacterium]|nr:M28 family peptidase [Blastocatellia bacterium]MDW8413382.1 M28 family peptidase [Acidobacteriota bacterium]
MAIIFLLPLSTFSCERQSSGQQMPIGDDDVGIERIAPTGFDAARAYEHVRHQVGFGPRPPGSEAIRKTRNYIRTELESYGLSVQEDAFVTTTPNPKFPRVEMVNLIAEIPGERPEVVIIGSHYDTKWFPDIHFVGANDGGSSTGVLIELARQLASTRPRMTLWLVFFDGEEPMNGEWIGTDNTYGSRHMVERLKAEKRLDLVKAMVLLDMVGDRDLGIVREGYSVDWLSDIIWQSARKLGYGKYFLKDRVYIEDDHVPFLRAGIPAIDLIDFNFGTGKSCGPGGNRNCYWHTDQDTLDKVSPESLKVVGDVVLVSLPKIMEQLR